MLAVLVVLVVLVTVMLMVEMLVLHGPDYSQTSSKTSLMLSSHVIAHFVQIWLMKTC